MQIGKISEPALKRSVLRPLYEDPASCSVHYGADRAAVKQKDGLLTIYTTVNEVPGFAKDPGKWILAASNHLAAAGAEPESFLISAMLPPDYEEQQLKADLCKMKEAALYAVRKDQDLLREEAAGAGQSGQKKKSCPIIGGHTQVVSTVKAPIYSVTGIGTAAADSCRDQRFLEPGDDLVVTNAIALGGTAALAKENEKELRSRYPLMLVERAKQFEEQMAVGEAARAITHFGAAAVKDLSQGGIFNALWEMADRSGVGLEVDLKKIPVRQETIEICEYFDCNPYYLYSAGALLVGTPHGEALVSYLASKGISAVVIGRATDGNDRIVRNGSEQRYLDRPKPDEWYRIEMETGGQKSERADINIS